METGNSQTAIIDNGTLLTKIGMSYSSEPSSVIQTQVHRQKQIYRHESRPRHYGDIHQSIKYRYQSPQNLMSNGFVSSFNQISSFWHHIFYNELRICPSYNPILLTQNINHCDWDRTQTTEIMFESFQANEFYLGNTAALSSFCFGRTTGLVVDSGDSKTEIVPVFEGYALRNYSRKYDVNGETITQYMRKILTESRNEDICSNKCYHLIRSMKQTQGQISINPLEDMELHQRGLKQPASYFLPSGKTISLQNAAWRCNQPFFKPHLINKNIPSLHQSIIDRIDSCDIELRKLLYGNIVLSGGCMMANGMNQCQVIQLEQIII